MAEGEATDPADEGEAMGPVGKGKAMGPAVEGEATGQAVEGEATGRDGVEAVMERAGEEEAMDPVVVEGEMGRAAAARVEAISLPTNESCRDRVHLRAVRYGGHSFAHRCAPKLPPSRGACTP